MSSTFRRIAAAALALPLALGMATSADAGSKFSAKSSGDYATTSWFDTRELSPGETEYVYGFLDVRGGNLLDVFGSIEVITCPDGEAPWTDEGDENSACAVDVTFVWAESEEVTLTKDRKGAGASLTGTVNLYEEFSDTSATAPIDVTWTGSGATFRARQSYTETGPDGVRYSNKSTTTGRYADVAGSIGDVIISGDQTYGEFGSYRDMVRDVIP